MRNRVQQLQKRNPEVTLKISIFVLFVLILLVFVLLFLPQKTAEAKNAPTGTYRIISIEIQPGDTLWSIATEYFSDDFGSVQSYISEIKRMNEITSDTLYAGAFLVVPYYQ